MSCQYLISLTNWVQIILLFWLIIMRYETNGRKCIFNFLFTSHIKNIASTYSSEQVFKVADTSFVHYNSIKFCPSLSNVSGVCCATKQAAWTLVTRSRGAWNRLCIFDHWFPCPKILSLQFSTFCIILALFKDLITSLCAAYSTYAILIIFHSIKSYPHYKSWKPMEDV